MEFQLAKDTLDWFVARYFLLQYSFYHSSQVELWNRIHVVFYSSGRKKNENEHQIKLQSKRKKLWNLEWNESFSVIVILEKRIVQVPRSVNIINPDATSFFNKTRKRPTCIDVCR